jgi:Lrp/AsnC family transcriptional regulator
LGVDAVDRKILRILQEDASLTVAEIGRAVGLSTTPCWKRIQKLEASGVIRKRVAIVAPEKVGFGVTAQVSVQSGDHARETVEAFIEAVRAMPEVLEFQRVAGDIDFCLRVVTVDIPHFEDFHRRLTSLMPLRRVSSYFELQQLKSETALPLALAPGASQRERIVDGASGG